MFSSATDEWATPQDFFDKLDAEFHFDLDVCATPENAKCARYYTKVQDGLKQPWGGDMLDESSIRQTDRLMGTKGMGVLAERSNRSLSVARKNRYRMVA